MNQDICNAIKSMHLLSFYYDGGNRIVEPHCLGVTTAGNPGLRAYQTSGHSESGKYGWKMFDLSKASSLKVLDETFSIPRPGYNPNDKGMSRIICSL
jgi:hypothetical protein